MQKKLKIPMLIAIVSVVSAFGVSAFSRVNEVKRSKFTPEWQLNSPMADQTVPSNYSLVTGGGPACGGSTHVCTIIDADNGHGLPKLEFGDPATHQSNYSTTFQP